MTSATAIEAELFFPLEEARSFLRSTGELCGTEWTRPFPALLELATTHAQFFRSRAEFVDAENVALGRRSLAAQRLGHFLAPCELGAEISRGLADASKVDDADAALCAGRLAAYLIAREIMYSTLGFESEEGGTQIFLEAESAEQIAAGIQAFSTRRPAAARRAAEITYEICAASDDGNSSPMSFHTIREVIFGLSGDADSSDDDGADSAESDAGEDVGEESELSDS